MDIIEIYGRILLTTIVLTAVSADGELTGFITWLVRLSPWPAIGVGIFAERRSVLTRIVAHQGKDWPMETFPYAPIPSLACPAFPTVLEPIMVGIGYLNVEGAWFGVNSRFCALTGYERAELLQKTLDDLLLPNEKKMSDFFLQELLRCQQPLSLQRARIMRKDGTQRWVRLTMRLICSGDQTPWYFICTLDDIENAVQHEETQEQLLKQGAADLKESREQQDMFLILQAITDTALAHLALDDFFRAVLGRIREIMKADNIAILLLNETEKVLEVRAVEGIEEASASQVRVPLGQGFAGTIAAHCQPLIVHDNAPVEIITPVLRKELRSLLGVPLVAQGRVKGVIHVGTKHHRDFTEGDIQMFQRVADRLALEIERNLLYEQAQQARLEALSHAQRMMAINQSLQDFIAIVSHQFRTALTSIVGFSRLLCSQEVQGNEATLYACDIEQVGQQLVDLVAQMVDFEHLHVNTVAFAPETLDFQQVAQEEIERVQETTRKHTIHLSLDEALPALYADPRYLRQMMKHLLSNAVKYTPEGGDIFVSGEREGAFMHLRVSDPGIGIPQQEMSKLFVAYTRISREPARYIQGTGLGLALVKQIAQLHQGEVWADSTLGEGSTFHVLLPLSSSFLRASQPLQ